MIAVYGGEIPVSQITLELEKIIPGAFYKFRDINSILITATAAYSDDIRGHSRGRGDVLRATFSRANAESIVWDHVVLDNLPRLADKFWQDPRLIPDDFKMRPSHIAIAPAIALIIAAASDDDGMPLPNLA